jgi:hypothetical protein
MSDHSPGPEDPRPISRSRRAGWSVGDVRGTLGWYVYGPNGENVVDATAATQAEA